MASTGAVKHRSPQQWQALLVRFAGCGMNVTDFCRAEGISKSNFYHWRRVLGDTTPPSLVPTEDTEPGFIDLGCLAPSSSGRLDIRLDLGGGMVLTVVRR